VITVTAPLQIWRNEEGSSHFLVLPDEKADEVKAQAALVRRGFGSVQVEVTLHDVTWRTSLFPRKSGGYFLPVKIGVCRKAAIAAGDQVTAALDLL
jgi:hypothetical protein